MCVYMYICTIYLFMVDRFCSFFFLNLCVCLCAFGRI